MGQVRSNAKHSMLANQTHQSPSFPNIEYILLNNKAEATIPALKPRPVFTTKLEMVRSHYHHTTETCYINTSNMAIQALSCNLHTFCAKMSSLGILFSVDMIDFDWTKKALNKQNRFTPAYFGFLLLLLVSHSWLVKKFPLWFLYVTLSATTGIQGKSSVSQDVHGSTGKIWLMNAYIGIWDVGPNAKISSGN